MPNVAEAAQQQKKDKDTKSGLFFLKKRGVR